ncbi:MAG TPA: peptidylprolyl isomerase [Terracidiphilus sp.]|nr:peptidylprolyl isomerase [Terracidiphilus sp.]
MIRFLQQDNRIVKAFFVVVIAFASVGMVIYLIPGLSGTMSLAPDTYAVVYPHWYSRFFSSGDTVSLQRVQQLARQQIQQRGPQYASSPVMLQFFEQQVGQQLVQEQILLSEANKLGVNATDDDVAKFLHQGQFGEVLFPNGNFIGQDRYADLIAGRFNMSIAQFEDEIKREIVLNRLRALITAPVTVSDQEVRDSYRKDNVKIKFDYAVVSADDLRKTINPSDADLESFFKTNSARYAHAVPEERSIAYFAFTADQVPGGVPQPSQQEIQQYYNEHQSDYMVPEQSKSRHILISVPNGADAKTDAAAKAKAEDVLKQLQNGGNWDALAKKYSDDPGSKDKGGELGFAKRGAMVPEFDNAIFTQKIGDIKIVKSQFGYHVVQVEERQTAHQQPLNEVLPTIQATLVRDKLAQAEDAYARTLTDEAAKNGLAKTAEAHHLQMATSPMVAKTGVIPALPDSAQILTKAFAAKQGDAPQSAPTGEGYAIFQLAGITAARAPSFADYKSHVLDDYREEKLPALVSQKTMELAAKAKADGNDLAKAAKEAGATVKTSDLVGETGQVPDVGDVGQVAPQLFDLKVGGLSAPINAERNGIVAKLVDKQEPTADEIAKNFDQTRDQMLDRRREDAFEVFVNTVASDYRKSRRVQINTKAVGPGVPGM